MNNKNFDRVYEDVNKHMSESVELTYSDASYSEEIRPVSKEDAFILSNSRRRGVSAILNDGYRCNTYELGDIARQIAAWENDKETREVRSDERKTVYINLYQRHLPKMDEDNIIDYNKDRGIIKPNPSVEKFEPYLEEHPLPETPLEINDLLEDAEYEETLTKSDAFSLISNSSRRKSLQLLGNTDSDTVEMYHLSGKIAALEEDKPVNALNSTERDRYKIPLYQDHLPKLDEYGIISYNQDRGIIKRDVLFEPILELLPELHEDVPRKEETRSRELLNETM